MMVGKHYKCLLADRKGYVDELAEVKIKLGYFQEIIEVSLLQPKEVG